MLVIFKPPPPYSTTVRMAFFMASGAHSFPSPGSSGTLIRPFTGW
jgi:hypothetical protein